MVTQVVGIINLDDDFVALEIAGNMNERIGRFIVVIEADAIYRNAFLVAMEPEYFGLVVADTLCLDDENLGVLFNDEVLVIIGEDHKTVILQQLFPHRYVEVNVGYLIDTLFVVINNPRQLAIDNARVDKRFVVGISSLDFV